ncbi:hypothetical protein ANN_17415 [Periplaneta americana]|uniref:Uncharacterized protein n=1 Tax=Periplaneta americana TaxID=6978 RepID=A0ABQ8SSW1_PERAM|nr:hypothetical protein ANN_17415 [Periplaneta americana]
MAGLCEGSNEPPGSLKAISKKLPLLREGISVFPRFHWDLRGSAGNFQGQERPLLAPLELGLFLYIKFQGEVVSVDNDVVTSEIHGVDNMIADHAALPPKMTVLRKLNLQRKVSLHQTKPSSKVCHTEWIRMRQLALSEEDEDLFNSQVNRTLYTVYRDNIDKFSHMWEQQGPDFWLKFCISLRSVLQRDGFSIQLSAFELNHFEDFFVDLAKLLTGKSPQRAKTDQPAAGLTATCRSRGGRSSNQNGGIV